MSYHSYPLLFSAPMVMANLTDAKDVTRRLTGLEKINEAPDSWSFVGVEDNGNYLYFEFIQPDHAGRAVIRCPYGRPEDHLWGRETFRSRREYDHLAPSVVPSDTMIWYEADGPAPDWAGKTRVSIHMPRWLSRLELEVREIHVERLAAITEQEAKREGMKRGEQYFDGKSGFRETVNGTYLAGFRHTWNKLNPVQSIHHNPWVFVVNYKRLKQF